MAQHFAGVVQLVLQIFYIVVLFFINFLGQYSFFLGQDSYILNRIKSLESVRLLHILHIITIVITINNA